MALELTYTGTTYQGVQIIGRTNRNEEVNKELTIKLITAKEELVITFKSEEEITLDSRDAVVVGLLTETKSVEDLAKELKATFDVEIQGIKLNNVDYNKEIVVPLNNVMYQMLRSKSSISLLAIDAVIEARTDGRFKKLVLQYAGTDSAHVTTGSLGSTSDNNTLVVEKSLELNQKIADVLNNHYAEKGYRFDHQLSIMSYIK